MHPDPLEPTPPSRWTFTVDVRDILLVVGGGLVVIGAAAVHWALAVAAIGGGLVALSKRLAR